jgi:hypothetical protein
VSEASVVVVGGRAAELSALRSLRVVLPSGEAYWTVVDQRYEVVEAADGFLRDLRFGADRDGVDDQALCRRVGAVSGLGGRLRS